MSLIRSQFDRFLGRRKEQMDKRSQNRSALLRKNFRDASTKENVAITLSELPALLVVAPVMTTELIANTELTQKPMSELSSEAKQKLLLLFLFLTLLTITTGTARAQDTTSGRSHVLGEEKIHGEYLPAGIVESLATNLPVKFENIGHPEFGYSYESIQKLSGSVYDDRGYLLKNLEDGNNSPNIESTDLAKTYCFPAAVWTYNMLSGSTNSVSWEFLQKVGNQYSWDVAQHAHRPNDPLIVETKRDDGSTRFDHYDVQTVDVFDSLQHMDFRQPQMYVIRPQNMSKVGHWVTVVKEQQGDDEIYVVLQSAPRSYVDFSRRTPPRTVDNQQGGFFQQEFSSAEDVAHYLERLSQRISATWDSENQRWVAGEYETFTVQAHTRTTLRFGRSALQE